MNPRHVRQAGGESAMPQRGTRRPRAGAGPSCRAFSLIEVMIAMFLFFMAVFTILALVSNTLRNARALQQPPIDAGMAAASSP